MSTVPTTLRSPPADDLHVEYVADPDAEPGDVTAALARLLIGMVRRRRERLADDQAGDGDT